MNTTERDTDTPHELLWDANWFVSEKKTFQEDTRRLYLRQNKKKRQVINKILCVCGGGTGGLC